MRSLTCIVCPIGCSLEVSDISSADNMPGDSDGSTDKMSADGLSVTGNRCPRGIVYAREEIRAPKRVVTATCKIKDAAMRIPVKTVSPCPREKIPSLLEDIYKIIVTLPVKAGDVVIADWKGEGINVIATRTLNAS